MWKPAAAALAAGALLWSAAQPAADQPDPSPAGGLPHDRLVLGLHPPERVAVLDARTGALVERGLPGGTLCHGPLMVSGNSVAFLGSRDRRPALLALGLGLRRPARVLDVGTQVYFPTADRRRLWSLRVRYGRTAAATGVRLLSRNGRVILRARRTPPAGYPVGVAPGGLVFERRGRVRIWNPRSGALSAAPGSWLVAASARGSAWCSGSCRRLTLESSSDARSSLPAPRGWSFLPAAGALSPDGSLLAIGLTRSGAPGRRIALVHTADGSLELTPIHADPGGQLDWSPSGEWLYVASAGRRITAYRNSDARMVTLPVRLTDAVIDLAVAPPASAAPVARLP